LKQTFLQRICTTAQYIIGKILTDISYWGSADGVFTTIPRHFAHTGMATFKKGYHSIISEVHDVEKLGPLSFVVGNIHEHNP
jgi:hypothetical protein